MGTKWEKMLRGSLYGKGQKGGNYAAKYPQFNDTMDGKWIALAHADGTVVYLNRKA